MKCKDCGEDHSEVAEEQNRLSEELYNRLLDATTEFFSAHEFERISALAITRAAEHYKSALLGSPSRWPKK